MVWVGGWLDLITISIPILIDMLLMNKNRYLYQFIPDVPDILKSPNILDFSYIPFDIHSISDMPAIVDKPETLNTLNRI